MQEVAIIQNSLDKFKFMLRSKSIRLMYEREGKPRNENLQNFSTKNTSIMDFFSKRLKDGISSSRNKAKYQFGDYHSYDTIISWLDDIESFYPDMAKVFTIGQTFEGRKIKGIKVL
ncbi:unnamed protein product [Onchocerca flexuosa]|uniref:Peptidase_M14 domain-containing protein n=1 Tax=Onchocerca flexuosa TaxID=387005 RepID=A0A183HNM7_9BILA|nr:unnamed protein product [Onchocerca flexuosa]